MSVNGSRATLRSVGKPTFMYIGGVVPRVLSVYRERRSVPKNNCMIYSSTGGTQ